MKKQEKTRKEVVGYRFFTEFSPSERDKHSYSYETLLESKDIYDRTGTGIFPLFPRLGEAIPESSLIMDLTIYDQETRTFARFIGHTKCFEGNEEGAVKALDFVTAKLSETESWEFGKNKPTVIRVPNSLVLLTGDNKSITLNRVDILELRKLNYSWETPTMWQDATTKFAELSDKKFRRKRLWKKTIVPSLWKGALAGVLLGTAAGMAQRALKDSSAIPAQDNTAQE